MLTWSGASAHPAAEPLFDPWPTPSGIDFTQGLWTDSTEVGHITNDNDADCPDGSVGINDPDYCPHIDPVHGFLMHDPMETDDRGKLVLFRDEKRFKVYNLNPNLPDPSDSSNFYNFHSLTDSDFFCSGHAYLPDGRLMIVGGTFNVEGEPATECWVSVYDASDEDTIVEFADAPGEPENPARYYPTCVAMPDGSILVVAGDVWIDTNDNGQVDEDIDEFPKSTVWAQFTASTAPIDQWAWTVVPNRIFELHGDGETQNYPGMRVIPRGLFWEGKNVENAPWAVWPWDGSSTLTGSGVREGDRRNSAIVVLSLYPGDSSQQGGKIFQVGGGLECPQQTGHQFYDAIIYDYDVSPPDVFHADTSTMVSTDPRRRPDAVILPDGKVLVMGGHYWVGAGGDTAVCNTGEAYTMNLSCELYDPGTDTWEEMDSLGFPRMYHSQALMLPDGRVFMSGNEGALADTTAWYGFRYEIFNPPALMDSSNAANNYYADRPTITDWDDEIGYDQTFEITVAPVASTTIDSVMIMRPSSVTHSNDTDQRRVVLAHSVGGSGQLIVDEPPDGTWAPPGVYMLIVLDSRGVWSEAKFVKLSPESYSEVVGPNEHVVWDVSKTLSADFVIAPEGTLTVNAGTVVTVTANTDGGHGGRYIDKTEIINRGGTIKVNGTSQQPVIFQSTGGNAGDWGGIWLDRLATVTSGYGYAGESRIVHAEIQDATEGIGILASGVGTLDGLVFDNITDSRHIVVEHTDVYVPYDGYWNLASPCTVKVAGPAHLGRNIYGFAGADTLNPTLPDIVAHGPFTATGTSGSPIVFEPAVVPTTVTAGDLWGGFFLDWPADSSSLSYVDIGFAKTPLTLFYQDATVEDSKFHHFGDRAVSIVGRGWTSGPVFRRNVVVRDEVGTPPLDEVLGLEGLVIESASDARIQDNAITMVGMNDEAGGSAIRMLNTNVFCLSTSSGDTLLVSGNEIVGPGAAPEIDGTWSGIRGDRACGAGGRKVHIASNFLGSWNDAAFWFNESADVQVHCNWAKDSWKAVEFFRSDKLTTPAVRFRSNVLQTADNEEDEDQQVLRTDNAEKIVFGPNVGGSTGWNQIVADGEDWFGYENDEDSGNELNAIVNYWKRNGARVGPPASAVEAFFDKDSWVSDDVRVDAGSPMFAVANDGCLPDEPEARAPASHGEPETSPAIAEGLPERTGLTFTSPSPFRSSMEIKFGIAQVAPLDVSLDVFDVTGRRVKRLVREPLPGGRYGVTWSADDTSGDRVAAGVYFVRFSTPVITETRKVLVLR